MPKEMYAQCLPLYLNEHIQSMLVSDSSLRPCCPKPHTVLKTFDKIHKHIFMSFFFFFLPKYPKQFLSKNFIKFIQFDKSCR